MVVQGFKPILVRNARILVLGSAPSIQSIKQQNYYAHPQNTFWKIIQQLTTLQTDTFEQKIAACQRIHLNIWDTLASCERKGSLDSAIKEPIPNNFESFFSQHPEIMCVAFNGKASQKYFKKYVLTQQSIPTDLTFLSLPSTSPAMASLSLDQKVDIWREELKPFM
jgi:TDG/mug DNA glycosylase family protein